MTEMSETMLVYVAGEQVAVGECDSVALLGSYPPKIPSGVQLCFEISAAELAAYPGPGGRLVAIAPAIADAVLLPGWRPVRQR